MTAYAHLINPNYRYTFAVFNYATGEVYTSSCDLPQYALHRLLHRMDGQRREAVREGYAYDLRLINLLTGKTLLESKG